MCIVLFIIVYLDYVFIVIDNCDEFVFCLMFCLYWWILLNLFLLREDIVLFMLILSDKKDKMESVFLLRDLFCVE